MDQQPSFTKSNLLDLSVHDEENVMGNMSREETKIRGELESEIENDLEEEIKDGIYQLALRLHRLYQNQKERINAKQVADSSDQKMKMKKKKNNKTLCEVNISIKMEGGTKIEVKEMKKEACSDKVVSNNNKKFDRAKSLRSGRKGPSPINRRSNQGGVLISSKYQGVSPNPNFDSSARRNLVSSFELGWNI